MVAVAAITDNGDEPTVVATDTTASIDIDALADSSTAPMPSTASTGVLATTTTEAPPTTATEPPTTEPPTTEPPTTKSPSTTEPPTTEPPTTKSPSTTEPPTTEPPTTETTEPPTSSGGCDPNYSGCVPIDSDVDCASGSGNGPSYVVGPVNVIGTDIYGLDDDGDGIGCENG